MRHSLARGALASAAVWITVLAAGPASAGGTIDANPNPVLIDPASQVTTTVTFTATAPDPLPADAITEFFVELTPAQGGVRVGDVPSGCVSGGTTVSCGWSPTAPGQAFTGSFTVSIPPGVPPQSITTAWSIFAGQSLVESGSGPVIESVDQVPVPPQPPVDPVPPPTPTPSASATSSPKPLPTAVPAGQSPTGGGGDSTPGAAVGLAFLAAAATGVGLVRLGRARDR